MATRNDDRTRRDARAMAMTTSPRRPPRWSKKTDLLVRHVALRCRPGLQSELGHWLENNSRFRAFITDNQDKIRKKLNSAVDEESRMDVRSELLVAYLLLADRRFELAFEAYGARRLGPDLSVTYRANRRFNLEVTRLRATDGPASVSRGLVPGVSAGSEEEENGAPASAQPGPSAARLANVIAGKLRQLPGDVPNALVISIRGLPTRDEHLAAAARLLKMHSDRKDDSFFARRGLGSARDFYAQYLHLSGVFALEEATASPGAIFLSNREARQPLPREAVAALLACLAVAGGAPT